MKRKETRAMWLDSPFSSTWAIWMARNMSIKRAMPSQVSPTNSLQKLFQAKTLDFERVKSGDKITTWARWDVTTWKKTTYLILFFTWRRKRTSPIAIFWEHPRRLKKRIVCCWFGYCRYYWRRHPMKEIRCARASTSSRHSCASPYRTVSPRLCTLPHWHWLMLAPCGGIQHSPRDWRSVDDVIFAVKRPSSFGNKKKK